VEIYSLALKEHQTGNIELAEKLYRDILATSPNNAQVLHLLSILLAEKKEYANAYSYIKQALEINPKSSSFHNTMGGILKNLNEYEDAMKHYQESIKLYPNNASVFNNIGNIFYKFNELQEAKKYYQKAIAIKPDYPDAHCNLSLVLIKQNSPQEAISHLEIAIQLQPNHDLAHQQLAYLLQLQGKLDQAIYHYNLSLKNNPHNILALHNLGVILVQKEKYDEAIPHFKSVLELNPEHQEALYNLSSIFLLQQKPTESLPFLLCLTQLNKDFDTYYNIGVIYMNLGRLNDALDYLNEAIKMRPNDFATHINLGSIYLRQENLSAAEKNYNLAHLLQPDNQEVSYILAAIRQNENQEKAPAEYIKNLFDQYAPYFDQHLKLLNCQVPQLLFTAVQNITDFSIENNSLKILDLGCGTGLCGEKFKQLAYELIGIDLSTKMLELADQKKIYTALKNISIEEAITSIVDLDLIIASESLMYFGALEKIFHSCYNILNKNGFFAFTVEKTDKYPYILQHSARFAHQEKYIEELAKTNNFNVLKATTINLRNHHDSVVMGYMFILQK
jgi:predicted TPR repeat methyltransferase